MSLKGYIFFENENYLKIKKRNVLNYNDIYLFIIYKNFTLYPCYVFFKKYTVIEMF